MEFARAQETTDPTLSYGENQEFLSHLHRYRIVTDRQTDRQNHDS